MTVPFETLILVVTAAALLQAVTILLWRTETRALRDTINWLNDCNAQLRRNSHRRDPRTGRILRKGE